MDYVEISAGQLLLRPWREGGTDVEAVRTAMADTEIQRWIRGVSGDPEEWLRARAKSWAEGLRLSFAVTDATTGTVLGTVGLKNLDRERGSGSLGYWVLPAGRGRGVAVSATDAAARWAFSAAGLSLGRISLDHAVENAASCAVARRAGFQVEGVARGMYPADSGARKDGHLHARLATD